MNGPGLPDFRALLFNRYSNVVELLLIAITQIYYNDSTIEHLLFSINCSCKMIHNERKNLMQSDAEYLRGFALFMSELFVHMSPKEGAGKFRILGIAVRELLQTLLSHPTPGNVKCLCQILKVSSGTINKIHLLEVQLLIFVFSYLDRTLRMTTAPVTREKLSKWTC